MSLNFVIIEENVSAMTRLIHKPIRCCSLILPELKKIKDPQFLFAAYRSLKAEYQAYIVSQTVAAKISNIPALIDSTQTKLMYGILADSIYRQLQWLSRQPYQPQFLPLR